MHPRRQFLGLIASAVAMPAVSRVARANTYPTRPVRILVGSTAGGGTDIMARLMGNWLSKRLGQPFTVEDRSGAGSNIATEVVVRAPSDGNTLLLVTTANAINATLYENHNFNFIRDIVPVAGLLRVPLTMVVHPSLPVRTVPEFIAYAKANPGKINMATGVNGGSPHVAGELFEQLTGIKMVQVSYRGLALALTDLLGGQVQVLFSSVPAAIELIRTKKLRALAVTTSTRAETLPDLPTVAEFVPGFEASQWYGVGAPKNTPAEIVETLNRAINAGLADPKLKAQLADLGGSVLAGTPAQFGELVAAETEKWGDVVRLSGTKVN
jgi:tripartite-type tricarboxylate transporter receptor subunit TctC